jgi:hypothetical protein
VVLRGYIAYGRDKKRIKIINDTEFCKKDLSLSYILNGGLLFRAAICFKQPNVPSDRTHKKYAAEEVVFSKRQAHMLFAEHKLLTAKVEMFHLHRR